MNIPERGLGRGLGSLLAGSSVDIPEGNHRELAPSQLVPGRHQPRRYFDDAALSELAASIKSQGIIQPLLVRELPGTPVRYEIVAGERRWRAARLAGLTTVPVIITSYTDKEAMTVALVENLQREDLDPMEEAEALQAMRDACGLSQEELAARIGKSRSAVANALRLLQLPEDMRDALGRRELSAGHARALLSVTDERLRNDLFHAVLERRLSVRETETAADACRKNGGLPSELLPGPKPAAGHPAARRTKPQAVRELQELLRRQCGMQATISGTEAKGRIQIPYASAEELARVLAMLGMKAED